MSAKSKSVWICSNCGYESIKWNGQCPSCGEWNTLEESYRKEIKNSNKSLNLSGYSKPILLSSIENVEDERYSTKINEFDRVLGGGIVKGSIVLLGGDPGIGKSTILLQMCNNLAKTKKVLYVSGEESRHQLKIRANRLGVNCDKLFVMAETNIEFVTQEINNQKPDLVIIDSIQTMNYPDNSSSIGSISQVKECTNLLMATAKSLDIPIIIVGHVNKDGGIAGPKVLEHIVDSVLYFEGDKQLSYRILRGIKNRYGSTSEIGVFEMTNTGLKEVENPSAVLLSGKPHNVSGSCITCIMEGSRPIFAEVQGLATSSSFGNPRRMSTGFDYNRLSLLLAVLEKRAGYFFSNLDTYVNIVGGIKLYEPASDLAVAISLISSLKDQPIDDTTLIFGEIGLAGEIRAVTHAEERILEAQRLGFKTCILPKYNLDIINQSNIEYNIKLIGAKYIKNAVDFLL